MVWDQYRWFIVGVIALSVVQAAMIGLLLVERSRRRRHQKRYGLVTAGGGVGVWSEQPLREAQVQFARVARLTALGEFAASVAHEVRQPLTSIVLNANACLRWLGSSQHDLTEIRAALRD